MPEPTIHEKRLMQQIKELDAKIQELHTKLESSKTIIEAAKAARVQSSIQANLDNLNARNQSLEYKQGKRKQSASSALEELRHDIEKTFHDATVTVENRLCKTNTQVGVS